MYREWKHIIKAIITLTSKWCKIYLFTNFNVIYVQWKCTYFGKVRVVAQGGGPQPGGIVHPPNPRGWLLGEVQAIRQIYL